MGCMDIYGRDKEDIYGRDKEITETNLATCKKLLT